MRSPHSLVPANDHPQPPANTTWYGGQPSHGGGGGGIPPHMEQRIAALEKGFEKLDSKLDKLTELVRDSSLKSIERLGGIETRLVAIEKTVEAKASTADLREISGRIASIPTTWQIVGIIAALLVGIPGLAFTIAKFVHP